MAQLLHSPLQGGAHGMKLFLKGKGGEQFDKLTAPAGRQAEQVEGLHLAEFAC